MQRQSNTAENSPTRGFTDLQFTQAVSYVPRPRRFSPLRWILFAIALVLLSYGTYFVLSKVLG